MNKKRGENRLIVKPELLWAKCFRNSEGSWWPRPLITGLASSPVSSWLPYRKKKRCRGLYVRTEVHERAFSFRGERKKKEKEKKKKKEKRSVLQGSDLERTRTQYTTKSVAGALWNSQLQRISLSLFFFFFFFFLFLFLFPFFFQTQKKKRKL